MKKKLIALLPYIALLGVDFYLLPFLVRDTGSAMLLMLAVMPAAAFVTAVAYGIRNGFGLLLPIVAPVLFVPTIFIYYNSSAWIYAGGYLVIVLTGTAVGGAFYRKR